MVGSGLGDGDGDAVAGWLVMPGIGRRRTVGIGSGALNGVAAKSGKEVRAKGEEFDACSHARSLNQARE